MSLHKSILIMAVCCFVIDISYVLAQDVENEEYVRVERQINFYSRGIPGRIPPTVLCNKPPCNTPGNAAPIPTSRGKRSLDNDREAEDFQVAPESPRIERDIKVTFPGSDRIPKPPTALCFRQPCNVPGGFNPQPPRRFRRHVARARNGGVYVPPPRPPHPRI